MADENQGVEPADDAVRSGVLNTSETGAAVTPQVGGTVGPIGGAPTVGAGLSGGGEASVQGINGIGPGSGDLGSDAGAADLAGELGGGDGGVAGSAAPHAAGARREDDAESPRP